MRLEQLHYLLEISKAHSISLASQTLHVTQPAISEAIKKLEEEFGILLLRRHIKGVEITVAGEEVVNVAKVIFQQIEQLKQHLDKLKHNELTDENMVLLMVTPFIGETFLFDLLNKMHAAFPELVILSEAKDARVIITDIADTQKGIGLTIVEEKNYLILKKEYGKVIDFYKLKEGSIDVMLPITHPLNHYASIPVHELIKYPLILPKNSCIPLMEVFNQYGTPSLFFDSNICSLSVKYLAEGKGIGVISSILTDHFHDHPFDEERITLKPLDYKIKTNLFLVFPKNSIEQIYYRRIYQFFQTYFI